MLKIRFCDNRLPPFWVTGTQFLIGRAKSNQLCLDEHTASTSPKNDIADTHAKITRRGESYFIRDMGSHGGTLVNNHHITQRRISCGDVIRIGAVELEIVDPFSSGEGTHRWSLIADSSWLSGQEFPLYFSQPDQKIILGRGRQCDIVIPGKHLSHKHAELSFQNNRLVIADLNSTAGTFVNEKLVKKSSLSTYDRIRLDVFTFKVFGSEANLPRSTAKTIKDATKHIETKLAEKTPRQWKTKPTSVGNRADVNLYKKSWLPLSVGAILIALFIGTLLYLFL